MPLRRAAPAPGSRGESISVNTEHTGPGPIVGRASSRGQVRFRSLSSLLVPRRTPSALGVCPPLMRKSVMKEKEKEKDGGLDPLLRMREVCLRAALGQSYVYELAGRELCPPFREVGPRASAMLSSDLDQWLAGCLALRAQMPTLLHPVVLPAWPPAVDVPVPCHGIQMARRPEVLALLSCSPNHLYRLMKLDDPAFRFPWPAPVGVRARRWALHEVLEWIGRRRSTLARRARERNPWICARPGSNGSDRRDSPPQ